MHPYEVASTLREREKHASVRLNYGSLYTVVGSLTRRGLIAPRETVRSGRLPERTVYTLTAAGAEEMHDWLAELVATPVRDYTSFEAALSFLPALAPDEALLLLRARRDQLALQAADRQGSRGLLGSDRVPRLFWVEEEYRAALRDAELSYLERLIDDIERESLDGLEWWTNIHREDAQGRADETTGSGSDLAAASPRSRTGR